MIGAGPRPDTLAASTNSNSPAAAVSWPPLTSVVQDLPGIAELYADSVRAALDGAHAPGNPAEPHIRLEVRESA